MAVSTGMAASTPFRLGGNATTCPHAELDVTAGLVACLAALAVATVIGLAWRATNGKMRGPRGASMTRASMTVLRTPTVLVLGADGRIARRASGQPRRADVIGALGVAVQDEKSYSTGLETR
jgi:hypothetical protein